MYGIIFASSKPLLVLSLYVFFNSESVSCGRPCGGHEPSRENGAWHSAPQFFWVIGLASNKSDSYIGHEQVATLNWKKKIIKWRQSLAVLIKWLLFNWVPIVFNYYSHRYWENPLSKKVIGNLLNATEGQFIWPRIMFQIKFSSVQKLICILNISFDSPSDFIFQNHLCISLVNLCWWRRRLNISCWRRLFITSVILLWCVRIYPTWI